MNVLQVLADGRPGGGTTYVAGLSAALLRRAIGRVHFVGQRDSYAKQCLREIGATVNELDFFRSRFDPRVRHRLGAVIREVRPDLIHVHGGRAAFFLSQVTREKDFPPVVYTVHGYHFVTKPWGVRYLAALAERRSCRLADETVFVCEYDRGVAREWELLPAERAGVVIYSGIETADLPAAGESDGRTIAFLGRLTHQKDPLLAVEVARELATEGYRLIMIGGGELEAQVRNRIRRHGLDKSVTVTGAVSRAEALAAMRTAGVMLMTSRWEGLPLAVMEAMAMGIPVVGADVGGVPELIENDVSGLLILDRQPRSFADAIRLLARAGDLRQGIIATGRDRIRRRFNPKRTWDQNIEVYRDLLR